jgi:1,4-alpha-glucan branching enzyme
MGSLLYPDGTCRFRVWAPFAGAVQLVGDFTGWSAAPVALASEGNGNWSADVPNVSAGQLYHYLITNAGGAGNDNSQVWQRADARALQVQNSAANSSSFVIDAFSNPDSTPRQPFTTPRFDKLILYQLHVGSFCGLNDGAKTRNRVATFVDVIDKLAYVRNLGFNAIALLPVGEVAGDVSEGYGICDMFAPEDAYATSPERAVVELVRLIDAAHANGLAVLFDLVFNHSAPIDNRYWRYDGNRAGPNTGGVYHENAHDTRFGTGFAVWRREVRDFFLDVVRTFLRDYRGDGLRFDATQFIPPDALGALVWQTRAEFPDKYLIAEYNPDDSESAAGPMDPFARLGFHATWDLASPGQTLDALSGISAVDRLLSMIGDFRNPSPWCSVRYPAGSHDQIYIGDDNGAGRGYLPGRFGGRQNGWARAKTRLAWALAATLPGTPMLFMGTEGLLDGAWDPSDSHGEHRLDWSLMGDNIGAPMQALVRDANNLRWTHPALRGPAGNVTHVDRTGQVVAFKRYNSDGDLLLIVVNVSDNQFAFHDYGVGLAGESGAWREIFNSQAPVYGAIDSTGNFNESLAARDGMLWINLPRWSVLVFQKT